MNHFEESVAAGLGEVSEGTVFLAAVSGGADSTAMLVCLAGLAREKGFTLHCIHVEHGIRPCAESRGDADAVKALCGKLGVPCRVARIPPGRIALLAKQRGTGIEAMARYFRRRAWNRERLQLGAERVLAAHTRDDSLELVLMRFLRGAGPAGLSGIPRERGRVLRPMLGLSRTDVLSYLKEKAIPYRTDSTNADTRYLRNKVRLKLIPVLDELFPRWQKPVLDLAETQALSAGYLKQEAERLIPWSKPGDGAVSTGDRAFFTAPPIIREEALFIAADMLLARNESNAHIRRAVIRRFARGEFKAADLGLLRIIHRDKTVYLQKKHKSFFQNGFSLLIKGPGTYNLKGISIKITETAEAEGAFQNIQSGFSSGFPLVFRQVFKDDYVITGGRRIHAADCTAACRGILEGLSASEYTGIICAEDAEGIEALIRLETASVLWNRETDRIKARAFVQIYNELPSR
jgi:tRNA(Ile)-lysidine synthase